MTSYASVGREQFLDRISPQLSLDDLEQVQAAYAFSKGAHRGQLRDDGSTRYFEHCKSVAWICIQDASIDNDWQTIVIALLHDSREDSFMLSSRRIELNFGRVVRQCVDDLTRREHESHEDYLNRLLRPGVDWRALTVKLADRLQNVRTLGSLTPEKRERQLRETDALYLAQLDRFLDLTPAERLPAIRSLGAQIADAVTATPQRS